MRVIAEIPRPECRISIFSMNQKFIIKFEQGVLEQTFKVSEMDIPDLETLKQLVDEDFIGKVIKRFEEMRADFFEQVGKFS